MNPPIKKTVAKNKSATTEQKPFVQRYDNPSKTTDSIEKQWSPIFQQVAFRASYPSIRQMPIVQWISPDNISAWDEKKDRPINAEDNHNPGDDMNHAANHTAIVGDMSKPAQTIECAFIGRSNSGKSSLINALCHQKNLARSGQTPGLTRAINIFAFAENRVKERFIVDLPGYGYAKMPKSEAIAVQQLMMDYLQRRTSLTAVVMVVDCRHLLKEPDIEVLEFLPARLHLILALSKCDQINRSDIRFAPEKALWQLTSLGLDQRFRSINIIPVSVDNAHDLGKNGLQTLRQWVGGHLLEEDLEMVMSA